MGAVGARLKENNLAKNKEATWVINQVVVSSVQVRGKCTRQRVLTARKNVKFLSSPAEIVRSTARTATRSANSSANRAQYSTDCPAGINRRGKSCPHSRFSIVQSRHTRRRVLSHPAGSEVFLFFWKDSPLGILHFYSQALL